MIINHIITWELSIKFKKITKSQFKTIENQYNSSLMTKRPILILG